MTGEHVTVALVVLAGLGLVWVWTAGARAGRKVERAIGGATRVTSTAGRAMVTAAVIVGVQWAVLANTDRAGVWAVLLGAPALFAGAMVARLLAVTETVRHVHGGHGRGGRR
ncbi:MAG: hypothetical protein AB7L91_14560 [Dehalococcoidia bacterium]